MSENEGHSVKFLIQTLFDQIDNLNNRIQGLTLDFLEYAEKNPKGDDQWMEARIRALEGKVKILEEQI